MPELPEVETVIRELRKKIVGRTICDVWSDAKKLVKKPKSFNRFIGGIKKEKIKSITRRKQCNKPRTVYTKYKPFRNFTAFWKTS